MLACCPFASCLWSPWAWATNLGKKLHGIMLAWRHVSVQGCQMFCFQTKNPNFGGSCILVDSRLCRHRRRHLAAPSAPLQRGGPPPGSVVNTLPNLTISASRGSAADLHSNLIPNWLNIYQNWYTDRLVCHFLRVGQADIQWRERPGKWLPKKVD
jgi:hypothetical protein